jgi:hypothetical protein
MTTHLTAPQTHLPENESLGDLLRSRALASSPRWLAGQLTAGVLLNGALLSWYPKSWAIATAALAAVALHALWSVALRRTMTAEPVAAWDAHAPEGDQTQNAAHGWWRVRRFAAFGASASALVLLWFVCMIMLGRLMS